MKNIPLSRGLFVLVDDEDYEEMNKFKWFACPNKHLFYAARNGLVKGKRRVVYMHRQLLGILESSMVTDHINGNSLDNTRSNLRVCTQAENVRNNSKVRFNNKYKGITKKYNGRFVASIQINKKHIHLGVFDKDIDAANAYDNAAIKYHGEFAKTNSEIYS